MRTDDGQEVKESQIKQLPKRARLDLLTKLTLQRLVKLVNESKT